MGFPQGDRRFWREVEWFERPQLQTITPLAVTSAAVYPLRRLMLNERNYYGTKNGGYESPNLWTPTILFIASMNPPLQALTIGSSQKGIVDVTAQLRSVQDKRNLKDGWPGL